MPFSPHEQYITKDIVAYSPSTASSSRLAIQTYNNNDAFGSSLRGERYRGTLNLPSGVLKDDTILHISADGYGASGLMTSAGVMLFAAHEDFTASGNGTYFRLRLTPSGGFAPPIDRIWIKENGNLGFSNNDPRYRVDASGAGNFTEGLLINGLNIGTGNFQNISGVLSDRLGATGSYLLGQIGAGTVASVNLKIGAITLLGGGNVSISPDAVLSNITISGNTGEYANFYRNSNPQQYTTSGNLGGVSGVLDTRLNSTGSVLDTKINSLSGYTDNSFSTIANLATTGSTLDSKINSLSGYSNNTFGTLTNLQSTGSNLQGQLNTVITNLGSTGSVLDGKINSLSGYTNANFNAVKITGSAILPTLNFTGAGNVTLTLSGSTAFFSGDISSLATSANLQSTGSNLQTQVNTLTTNLASSGSTLDTKINSLSGYSNNTFATITNLGSTGSNLQGQINTLTTNLGTTGSVLDTKINSLSGYSNSNFNAVKITGSSILPILNLTGVGNVVLYLSGSTVFVSGDTSLLATVLNLASTGSNLQGQVNTLTSNLASTGSVLDTKINSLSGYSNATFATISNLQSSGSNLQGQINTLTTNLFTTGSILSTRIDSLSGYVNANFNAVKVTGSNILPILNFTGFGGIVVGLSGSFAYVSGAIGGGNGEVNTASSVGLGQSLFKQKAGVDLQFYSLSGGTGYSTRLVSDVVFIDSLPSSGNYILLNDQLNESGLPTIANAMEVYSKQIANNDFLYFKGDYNSIVGLGASVWSKHVQYISTAITSNQTTVGTFAPNNAGTVSHIADQFYGWQTNYATAANPNVQAGTSFTSPNLLIGNISGQNGFFVTSRFAFPDSTGTYASGAANSGARFFFGLTDQTLQVSVGATDPAGNRAGFSWIAASGGSTSGRSDINFKFSTKNNTTETLIDTSLPFNSGLFQGYIFMPTFPNTGNIFWQLEDLGRRTKASGLVSTTLPLANTALRPSIGLHTISGVKNLRTQILYAEV